METPECDYVGCGLDDLPERAVGAFVVDAAGVVRALFYQHAETDEAAEFFGRLSLQDHLAGEARTGRNVACHAKYPEGQSESARSAEELLAYVAHIHWRVPGADPVSTMQDGSTP
jgi:hypothetical protein